MKAKRVKNKFSESRTITLFILIIASFFRFYGFSDLAFDHDELSALLRLDFESFSDLFKFGVAPDGHPALVHVFLYLYTKVFGINEGLLKLPFVLAGIASVYFAIKISAQWFEPQKAYLVGAFMSVMQFFIGYSQFARPYSFGLLFALMAVYYGAYYFLKQSGKTSHLIWYVIGSALAIYSHYFSAFEVILFGSILLFYSRKEDLKTLLLSGFAIIVLFSPHFIITFEQLSHKGLEWLAKPNIYFFIDFFQYIFHFSYVAIGLYLLWVLNSFRFKKSFSKFHFIALILAIVPIVVGYGYSHLSKPILQYSTLYFCTPFLLMLIVPSAHYKGFWILPSLILLIMVKSFFVERNHVEIEANLPFKSNPILVADLQDFFEENKVEGFTFLQKDSTYYDWYVRHQDLKIDFKGITNDNIAKQLETYIDSEYLIIENAEMDDLYRLSLHFPKVWRVSKQFTSSLFVLGKRDFFGSTRKYEAINFDKSFPLIDNMKFEKGQEWGETILIENFEAPKSKILLFRCDFTPSSTEAFDDEDLVLVVEAEMSFGNKIWRGNSEIIKTEGKTEPLQLITSVDLNDLVRSNMYENCISLKVYLWNRSQKEVLIANVYYQIIKSNCLKYSRFEPYDCVSGK